MNQFVHTTLDLTLENQLKNSKNVKRSFKMAVQIRPASNDALNNSKLLTHSQRRTCSGPSPPAFKTILADLLKLVDTTHYF